MSYQSETIEAVLPRINTTYLLPAMQREFVWTEVQICELFDSLMRRYPISSFLFWKVPPESRDDVEAYEFLSSVKASQNRSPLARSRGRREITFVLDGQQRLTALLVGLQGTYLGKKTKIGKGARTPVPKKMYLDLLHDGKYPDTNGETYYRFAFFDIEPLTYNSNSYWFEVGRILDVNGQSGFDDFIDTQVSALRGRRTLNTYEAEVVEHNLKNLFEAVWLNDAVSYYTETDPDHERILEIFVRANSGGTKLSKSDLLLSTLTLHWGTENAREVINEFVKELNCGLAHKNNFNKDFVMKSCLVLLDLPVSYRVSSFTKETCARIKERWPDVQQAIKRAVDAVNVFGIDENNLTSANALVPIAYYLYQHPRLTLLGESNADVLNAKQVRIWFISALLNHVLGGTSDTMLSKLRETLQIEKKPNCDFPIAALDETVRATGRVYASSKKAFENIFSITYGKETCFLALSLLYDDRNWGTISHSIDHLFPRAEFKRKLPDRLGSYCDDFGNLALVIRDENSGKKDRPLDEWLATRSPEYLKRHLIPPDPSLWHIERFEDFLIERRKLIQARLKYVFSTDEEDI